MIFIKKEENKVVIKLSQKLNTKTQKEMIRISVNNNNPNNKYL